MCETPDGLLRLFQAERRRLVGLIYRIVKNRSAAEDLAQDTFLRLWGKNLTEKDRPLLFRTAQNLALDYTRAQRVRGAYLEETRPEQVAASPAVPDAQLAARQELKGFLEALKTLPERAQRVFLLSRLDELPYPHIAKILGVSVSTVEKDMIRALDVCRRYAASRRPE